MKTFINLLKLIAVIFVFIALTNLWLLAFEDVSTSAIKVVFFTKFLMYAICALLAVIAIDQWFQKRAMEQEYDCLAKHYQAEIAKQHLTGFIQRLEMDDLTDNLQEDLHSFIEQMDKQNNKKSNKKSKK